jgi:predicted metal-binding protein
MKNILLTCIILVSLTVCEFKKSNPSKKNVAESQNGKAELITQKVELNELEIEEKLREEINTQYLSELSKCSQSINAVTDFNGKTEFWRICKTDNGKRIIQINSHEETALYEEVYFEQNGELVYAEESINYMPINHFVLQPWTCQFYAEKGKLVSLMSLGHGKTENDEWNPEIIFEMYKSRIAELNKIAQE